jgi:hypothetical protein
MGNRSGAAGGATLSGVARDEKKEEERDMSKGHESFVEISYIRVCQRSTAYCSEAGWQVQHSRASL